MCLRSSADRDFRRGALAEDDERRTAGYESFFLGWFCVDCSCAYASPGRWLHGSRHDEGAAGEGESGRAGDRRTAFQNRAFWNGRQFKRVSRAGFYLARIYPGAGPSPRFGPAPAESGGGMRRRIKSRFPPLFQGDDGASPSVRGRIAPRRGLGRRTGCAFPSAVVIR